MKIIDILKGRSILDDNDNVKPPTRRHLTVVKSHSKLSLVPTIENVMNDAISLLAKEVAEMQSKYTRPGMSMDIRDATKLSKYVKALVELSREERAREQADDLSKMSNDQLIEMAAQHLKQVENSSKKAIKKPDNNETT